MKFEEEVVPPTVAPEEPFISPSFEQTPAFHLTGPPDFILDVLDRLRSGASLSDGACPTPDGAASILGKLGDGSEVQALLTSLLAPRLAPQKRRPTNFSFQFNAVAAESTTRYTLEATITDSETGDERLQLSAAWDFPVSPAMTDDAPDPEVDAEFPDGEDT